MINNKGNSSTLPLVAGIEKTLYRTKGRNVFIKEASAELYVRFDDGPLLPIEKGISLEDPDVNGFEKIGFYSAVDQSVTYVLAAANDGRTSGSLDVTGSTVALDADPANNKIQIEAIAASVAQAIAAEIKSALLGATDADMHAAMVRALTTYNADREGTGTS